MAELTLVLGGVRSGKSRWAEHLAAASATVTYLATALVGDEEMTRRVAQHRQRRPASWRTIEEPWEPAAVIARNDAACLLLECVGLWLTNLLVGLPDRPALDDPAVRVAVTHLRESIGSAVGRIIIVSNEVGCGIVPVNDLARRFGDLLGEANQQLAADAGAVYWCVAGIPVRIKGNGSGTGG